MQKIVKPSKTAGYCIVISLGHTFPLTSLLRKDRKGRYWCVGDHGVGKGYQIRSFCLNKGSKQLPVFTYCRSTTICIFKVRDTCNCDIVDHLQLIISVSLLSHSSYVPNMDDFRAFLGHHEVFYPLILSHHEILEAVTSIFFHCIHISLPDPNTSHTTFICNRNVLFYSPPTCVSSFSSTTLMFTVTFLNTSKLSSDESVTVLDAVAWSAINDVTSNFSGIA